MVILNRYKIWFQRLFWIFRLIKNQTNSYMSLSKKLLTVFGTIALRYYHASSIINVNSKEYGTNWKSISSIFNLEIIRYKLYLNIYIRISANRFTSWLLLIINWFKYRPFGLNCCKVLYGNAIFFKWGNWHSI